MDVSLFCAFASAGIATIPTQAIGTNADIATILMATPRICAVTPSRNCTVASFDGGANGAGERQVGYNLDYCIAGREP